MKRKCTFIAALFCMEMLAAMFFSPAVYAQTINDVSFGPNVALEATAAAGHYYRT